MSLIKPKPFGEKGWRILRGLQQDARLPFAELGRRVGLSTPSVAERVHNLEAAGILTGYHARVDLAKLGLPEAAERDGDLRVVDESGEDCLFAADRLVAVEVPAAVRASLLRTA